MRSGRCGPMCLAWAETARELSSRPWGRRQGSHESWAMSSMFLEQPESLIFTPCALHVWERERQHRQHGKGNHSREVGEEKKARYKEIVLSIGNSEGNGRPRDEGPCQEPSVASGEAGAQAKQAGKPAQVWSREWKLKVNDRRPTTNDRQSRIESRKLESRRSTVQILTSISNVKSQSDPDDLD